MEHFCPRCGQVVTPCVSEVYAVCFACTAASKAFVYVALAGQKIAPAGGVEMPSALAGPGLATRRPVDVAELAAWRKSIKPRRARAA